MHRIDKGTDVLGIYLGMNSMTKIEHMSIASTKAGQYVTHFFANPIRVGVENAGVHIALQGNVITS